MKTQLIVHRGFWKSQPGTSENSIQALKNAQKLKVYGSEFDVQMTKDEELIVFHDEQIGDLEIAETDFDILKKVKLSNAESIPRLEDYFIQGQKFPNCKLIVELKPSKNQILEEVMVRKTMDLIQKYNIESQCEIISFSLHICCKIKEINPKMLVYYLNGDLAPNALKKLGLDGFDYDYEILLEHLDWIAEARKIGLKTNAWTVDDAEVYQKLVNANIDFVTTNTPDIFLNE